MFCECNDMLDEDYNSERHTEYPTTAITQSQLSSYDATNNSRGLLGKQTSDLKITFVRPTPLHSLSLLHFLLFIIIIIIIIITVIIIFIIKPFFETGNKIIIIPI